MIRGIGLDLCEVDRMRELEARFFERFYTEAERAYVAGRGAAGPESAAGIFAAKEAALKAFGTGLHGMRLTDIEVLHLASGAPYYAFYGEALAMIGQGTMHLTITHTRDIAAAVAVWEGGA